MMESFLIAIGGALGALMRYAFSCYMQSRFPSYFPYGTLMINTVGCFLLGMLFALSLEQMWAFAIRTGLLGAFTTFSTVQIEVIALWKAEKYKQIFYYLVSTYTLCFLLAFLGYYIVIMLL